MADRAQILITAIDQTKSAFESVKRNLGGLADAASRVNSLLANLGAAVSVAGLGAMVKASLDTADSLAKMSQRVGVAVESLSTLIHVAGLSGLTTEKLETGLRKLAVGMMDAAAGSGEAARTFAAIGVAIKDQDGALRATDQVLLDLADKFKSMPDGAEKAALAVELFGKSGAEMIPFLNQGSAGIKEMTAEMQALGVQLGGDTAARAEAFNDAMAKIRLAVSSIGNRIIEAFLPALNAMAAALVESAKKGGALHAALSGVLAVLKTLALGAATVGNIFIAMGEAIGASVAAAMQALKGNVANAKIIIGELKDVLVKRLDELAEFRNSLFNPKPIEVKAPKIQADPELLQRLAKTKTGVGKAAGNTQAAQIALVKAQIDAEMSLLKEGLARQKSALDAALEDRLVSVRDYYAEKTRIEQREIDAEIARARALLAEQQRIAAGGKTESDRLRAKGEVAKIEADLIALNNKRADIEVANARKAAQAERELADALEDARLKLAEITGTATDADRRAAIERSYRDLRARLAAEGDAGGVSIIDRLIDVEAAQRNLQALENEWRLALERMRAIEQSVNIQQGQGLMTSADAQAKIAEAHREAAAALDALLPKMEAAAQAIGPDAVARVQTWKNELASVKNVVDPVAASINATVKDAFVSMFESIGSGAKSAKEAFAGFARSVLAAIQRILAQRFAEQLFGAIGGASGGIGGFLAGILKFASGGPVPGSGTGDTVPALLTPGEYVIRRDAVRRFGVGLLDAINGLRLPPSIIGGRLAFAAGGLVPEIAHAPAAPAAVPSQAVRIVNVIDPGMAADYLNSAAGEKTILNVLSRNGSAVRELLR